MKTPKMLLPAAFALSLLGSTVSPAAAADPCTKCFMVVASTPPAPTQPTTPPATPPKAAEADGE